MVPYTMSLFEPVYFSFVFFLLNMDYYGLQHDKKQAKFRVLMDRMNGILSHKRMNCKKYTLRDFIQKN